jgi:transposase-like protein
MTGLVRARYTLEFKEEAVRLVLEGQTVSSMAKTLIFRIRRCITG